MENSSSKQKLIRQLGVSLIEVLIVVSVIGAGAAIAYIVGNKRIQSAHADKATMALVQISKSIQGISSTNLNYAVLSVAPENVIPATLIESNGQLKQSPWGDIALTTNAGGKPHESYSVTFFDVPPYGCVSLASKGYDGFASVEINGNVAWMLGSSAPDPAALSNACQQPANSVRFTSQKLQGVWVAPSPLIPVVYPVVPAMVCTPPQVLTPDKSACLTPSTPIPLTPCNPPQYLASTASGIVCIGPGSCLPPLVKDAATGACINPPSCPLPQIWDSASGSCKTPPVTCAPPQVWDAASGSCKTPPVSCPPPQVWDAASALCINPPSCTLPQVWDSASGTCKTPLTCAPPQVWDAASGACITPLECHSTCVGQKLADGCFEPWGGPLVKIVSNPVYFEGACGFTLPSSGTVFETTCYPNGILLQSVSDGPGVGFHYTYGTC